VGNVASDPHTLKMEGTTNPNWKIPAIPTWLARVIPVAGKLFFKSLRRRKEVKDCLPGCGVHG